MWILPLPCQRAVSSLAEAQTECLQKEKCSAKYKLHDNKDKLKRDKVSNLDCLQSVFYILVGEKQQSVIDSVGRKIAFHLTCWKNKHTNHQTVYTVFHLNLYFSTKILPFRKDGLKVTFFCCNSRITFDLKYICTYKPILYK